MFSFSKKQQGFTMTEVLVVMAIIGIMSATLFASLTSNKYASRLQAAQREVASTLKLAQTYALQGKNQSGETPCGYGFKFTNSSDYIIFYNTAGGSTNYDDCAERNAQSNGNGRQWISTGQDASVPSETYSLKNEVTLRTGGGFGSLNSKEIYFTIPHATPFDSGGDEFAPSDTLVLTLEISGARKTVTFSAGGSVSEGL